MAKIRFLKVTTNYPSYIEHMQSRFSGLQDMPYAKALHTYLNDAYGWADFWKTNLELTGNFECGEIVMNVPFLQKKWAEEQGIRYGTNWVKEILTAQIAEFKPDVLLLVDLYNDNALSATIKKQVPSIKLLMGWDGILWHKPSTYEHCDVILTCVASTVDFYKAAGKTVYYHKFGFEPGILSRLTKQPKPYHVSFTGSLVPHPDYHLSRMHAVAELSRRCDMNIWASSVPANWHILNPTRLYSTVRHRQWRFGRDLHQVGSKNKGEVFGLDMFNVLYNSKIVFNTHGDNSPRQAANMRMTEVTGCGALLLTDWKENLHEFFVPDEEVVTYRSIDEAADKIKQLLGNEALRHKIAVRGQQRTLGEYSYEHRMQQLANFLYNYF